MGNYFRKAGSRLIETYSVLWIRLYSRVNLVQVNIQRYSGHACHSDDDPEDMTAQTKHNIIIMKH